jgi:excisionase family DNA binding protein
MKAASSDSEIPMVNLARVLEQIEAHLAALRNDQANSPQEWLKVDEAAEYLKVSRDTIERLIASGQMRAAAIDTPNGCGRRSRYRIRRDWLDDYMVNKAGKARGAVEMALSRRRRLKLSHDFFG